MSGSPRAVHHALLRLLPRHAVARAEREGGCASRARLFGRGRCAASASQHPRRKGARSAPHIRGRWRPTAELQSFSPTSPPPCRARTGRPSWGYPPAYTRVPRTARIGPKSAAHPAPSCWSWRWLCQCVHAGKPCSRARQVAARRRGAAGGHRGTIQNQNQKCEMKPRFKTHKFNVRR